MALKMFSDKAAGAHVWRFFRAGGFDQVRLDTGADVAALGELDQKLWVALACPTRGIEFDETTLDLIDADHDGRIRAPDLLAAVNWAVALLKNPEDLTLGRAGLPLDAIQDGTPDGQQILASARAILRMLGKPQANEVSLADTADIELIYKGSAFNGDGVIPVDAAEDEATRRALADIMDCAGSTPDRSGKPGVSQAIADRFFAEATAYAAWAAEAVARPAEILPLGERTAAAGEIVGKLAEKIDDYFTRCRLAAFDPRGNEALNPPLEAYAALAGKTINPDSGELGAMPIAAIAARRPLPLDEGINPAWAELMARLKREVVVPLIGERDRLGEAEWTNLKTTFDAYHRWLAAKPANAVEKLGAERIEALAAPAVKQTVDDLIARDAALAPEMSAIAHVEKLCRFQRDLMPLLNNIVSLRDFYTRAGKAMFQAGTLYLDGRSCDLCVKVQDAEKHGALASLSRIYLAYCLCSRAGTGEKLTIAAAFTAGDSDNLRVGRNGVFYDRKGRDWDASIIKIVEHPISLSQAFWLPYKQASRMIGEQIQKFAAARAAASQTQLQTQMMARTVAAVEGTPVTAAAPAPPPSQSQAFDAARMAGIFAAIGLAIGAIGTAAASVVTGFLNLSWWQMPLAVAGLILLVSGPSMLIAAMKLRNRNLGPILDASGWAVNMRLKVNIPFGTALTAVAALPPGAQRSLSDPYAEKRKPWELYVGIVVAVLILAGLRWSGLLALGLQRLGIGG